MIARNSSFLFGWVLLALALAVSVECAKSTAGRPKPLKQGVASGKADENEPIKAMLGDSSQRAQLIKTVADIVRTKAADCPASFPIEFCRQPLTFFLWLKEYRKNEKEREMYDSVKQVLISLLAHRNKNNEA